MKYKIFAPMSKEISSQMVHEGVVAVKSEDGNVKGYNLKGDARMVKQYDDATKSAVFEAMKNEMQPGELIVASD